MASKKPEKPAEQKAEAENKETEQERGANRYFFPGELKTPSKAIWADSYDEALAQYNQYVREQNNG